MVQVLSPRQPVGALPAALGLSLYLAPLPSTPPNTELPRHLNRGALQGMSSGHPKHHRNEPQRHNVGGGKSQTQVSLLHDSIYTEA